MLYQFKERRKIAGIEGSYPFVKMEDMAILFQIELPSKNHGEAYNIKISKKNHGRVGNGYTNAL